MKKSFKRNDATDLFINKTEDPVIVPDPAEGIPKGYRLVPEKKSERMQLLVSPTIKETIKELADKQGTSTNDLINKILLEYIAKEQA